MTTPLWVQVIWSESADFEDKELIPFIDFEIRALKVAMKRGFDNGYYKTKVNVLFNDGNEYQCRLDLAADDTHGFEHHTKNLISWYKRQEDDSCQQDMYADCYNFFNSIVWPGLTDSNDNMSMTTAEELIEILSNMDNYEEKHKLCRDKCLNKYTLLGSKRVIYEFPDESKIQYHSCIDIFEVML